MMLITPEMKLVAIFLCLAALGLRGWSGSQATPAGSTSSTAAYTYSCNTSGYSFPITWAKSFCCQPGTNCVGMSSGVPYPEPNFTGTPYSGTLQPGDQVELTLECTAKGKPTGVKLKHKDIHCSHQRKDKKLTFTCKNKKNKAHDWSLDGFQCPQAN